MTRVNIKDFNEGLIKKVSSEDLPKNACAEAYDITVFDELGVLKTRKGRSLVLSPQFNGTLDLKYTSLFESPNIFIKGDSVLYRGVRPIKQNLALNRADFTEFADWLIVCDGTNILKYKSDMTLSWLTSCCFDFEEANIPSGWTIHQSCIPFRVSNNTAWACTQDWERATIDSETALESDGLLYTSSCDLGSTLEVSPPDADMLLHFNGSLSDTMGNHSPAAVGGAATDASNKKFGSASLYLDGTGDAVTVADSDYFSYGSGIFTTDLWFAIPSGSTVEEHCLFSQVDADCGFALWYSSVTETFHFWMSNGSQAIGLTAPYIIVAEQWYHIALVKGWGENTNMVGLCVDGVLQDSVSFTGSFPDVGGAFRIGQIDADYDGSLLDFGADPHTVTHTNMVTSATQKKWGEVSLCHDGAGTGIYSRLVPYADYDIDSQSAFTFEFWFHGASSDVAPRCAFLFEDTRLSNYYFYVDVHSDDSQMRLVWRYGAASAVNISTPAGASSVGVWVHYAVVCDGSNIGLYINGDQQAFRSGLLPYNYAINRVTLMYNFFADDVTWYCDEIRWYVGNPFSAVPDSGLTDSFAAPTIRHEADDDTLFLIRPTGMEARVNIDEFRHKKGLARWTGDFSVPAGQDDGSGATVSTSGSLSGDIAVPLGIDGPSSAITTATGAAGVLTGNYKYRVTFVNTDSFESNPSPASATVSPSSDKVELSDIPQSNNPQCVSRNIYRTEAGGSSYYLLTNIGDNHTTTYSDNIADSSLTTILETSGHDAPPALQAIHSHGSRIFGVAAGSPNKLVWCNAWDEWEYFDPNNFETFGSASDNTKKLVTLGEMLMLIQKDKAWTFDTRLWPEWNWRKREGRAFRGVLSPVAALRLESGILCADARGGYLSDGDSSQSVTISVDAIFDAEEISLADNDAVDVSKIDYLSVGYFRNLILLSYPSLFGGGGGSGSSGTFERINRRTIVYNRIAKKVECIMKFGFSSFSTDFGNNILYAAGQDGYIYKLFYGTADDGVAIPWRVKTKDFNGEIGPEMLLKEAGHFWIDCNPNGGEIAVHVYFDDSIKMTKVISGSNRAVTVFKLPTQNFYRISFHISGSGPQKVYRLAFEADILRGESEIQR
jgi:hypothetical protein